MAISLYQATVPQFVQMLSATADFLDKAEGWAKEAGLTEEEVLGSALAPDMWPLAKQFQIAANNTASAIAALLSGTFSPDLDPAPRDFASLRTLLEKALTVLKAVDPASVDAAQDNMVAIEVRGNVWMRFKGDDFLLSFAQPNFYFHITAAYSILRHLGMPLGKRDYLGMVRAQQPA